MIKRILSILLTAITVALSGSLIELESGKQVTGEYYTNPLGSITHIGDPFILYDEPSETYYMYCTAGNFKCWSSKSFGTWKYEGEAYTPSEKSFGTQSYWAPEVYRYNGSYYMVYSAAREDANSKSESGIRHSIGIAKADNPAGPFVDIADHPLFAPDYSVIDANLFFDDDGRVYLLFAKDCSENTVNGKRTSQIFGVELERDLTAVIGDPVLLTTPTDTWEKKSGSTLWNEGPCLFKRNGIYYLLFTANYYASTSYAVGYATAASPLGTYTKSKSNPILQGDGIYTSGTGHCSVTVSPDGSETFLVYHSHADVKQATNPIANRTPCADRLLFGADGSLTVNGPSVSIQPPPSGAVGLYRKQDGVTVTSMYTTLAGNPEVLADDRIPYSGMDLRTMYRFGGKGYIELTYDEPIRLRSLWIYGINMVQFSPESVYAVINDMYKTKARYFTTSKPFVPVVLLTDTLPDDVPVQNVKLYFTYNEGTNGAAAIGEIFSVYR